MKNHLKPMGVRDVLDSTFTIMRENFWSFQGVFFKAFLPAFIILFTGMVGMVVYFVQLGTHTNIPITNPLFWSELGHNSTSTGIIQIVVFLVFILSIIALVIGGIYYTYGNFKIFKNGLHDQKTSSKQAFQGVNGKRWRIFLVELIVGLMLYIVAIPGLILTVRVSLQSRLMGNIISYSSSFLQMLIGFFFCMALPVKVFEDFKAMKSIGRGFKLMSKHRWRIFWTLLLVYLLVYVLAIILIGLVAVPVALAFIFKNIIAYTVAGLFGICGWLILVQLMAFFYGPLTAIYYDLLIRKEGYDISVQLAVDQQGESLTQSL